MSDVYESIAVRRNQYSDSYEGCSDCIHENDTIEICKMRECVHAFSMLKDCYIPKKEATNDQVSEERREDE